MTTLYEFFRSNVSFTQANYEFVHKIVDTAHTTTAWYDTDAMSLASIVEKLETAGKGHTTAYNRIKAAMLGTRLQCKGE